MIEPTAIVQTIDEQQAERAILDRAIAADSQSAWTVGECASEWTQKHSRGRTDADFARMTNSTPKIVNQRRLVWERFGESWNSSSKLSWTHCREALAWDDADECLRWANECEATIGEMKAWRRVKHGEDLKQDDKTPPRNITDADADEPIWKPEESQPAAEQSIACTEESRGRSSGPAGKNPDLQGESKTKSKPKETATTLPAVIDPVVLIRDKCGDDRETTLKQIWQLLKELDPANYKRAKPTRAALLGTIPDNFDPLLREAATQWAEFKLDLAAKARIQNMGQWHTVLKQMTQYPPAAVLDSVEDAIANGWQGWKHGLKDAAKLSSARVRNTQSGEPVYRDFE